MKNLLTGLLCLGLLGFSSTAMGRAQEDSPQAQPQQPTPAQPTPPPQTPPPQQTETPQPGQGPNLKLPPPRPKVVDVRMPGEAGFYVGITGWLPFGQPWVDKGHQADFTGLTRFQIPGRPKVAPGAEIGIAAGQHNSLKISYFQAKANGNTTAPTDLVIFSQPYSKGDQLSTNYKLQDVKLSYEYLTWPYPVESRHFRLKTLWQVQYMSIRSGYDAPIRSNTPDSAGNLTSFQTQGSKSYFTPTLGLGVAEYASRNFRFEANASGFAIPHHFNMWDADASISYRVGHIELRGGVNAFHFRSSAKSDYYLWGTLGGGFVGLRWYSD